MAMYFRVAIKGTLGTNEVWSCNPVYDPELETFTVWNQAYADEITQAMGSIAIPANLAAYMGSDAKITSYRLEGRDDATDALLGVSETALATPKAGSGATAAPPQTSIVASLRSNTPTASGRGRLYWPALKPVMAGGTLRIAVGGAAALSTDFSSYLTSIARAILSTDAWAPWTQMPLVVRSKKQMVSRPVVRIQVGDVLDVQRRRRDSLKENYSDAVYPAP